jgi:hypothetical protein
MDFESSINTLVTDTVSKTKDLKNRMHSIVAILNSGYNSIIAHPDSQFQVDGKDYDFDDVLILIFEFVQLSTIFKEFKGNEDILLDFLTAHSPRLIELCIQGKLNYINEIIEFRRIVSLGSFTPK